MTGWNAKCSLKCFFCPQPKFKSQNCIIWLSNYQNRQNDLPNIKNKTFSSHVYKACNLNKQASKEILNNKSALTLLSVNVSIGSVHGDCRLESFHFADPKLLFGIRFLCFSSSRPVGAFMQEVGKRESCARGICVTGLWNSEMEWPGAEEAPIIWVLALHRCRGGMCFTWSKVLIWHKWQPLGFWCWHSASRDDVRCRLSPWS